MAAFDEQEYTKASMTFRRSLNAPSPSSNFCIVVKMIPLAFLPSRSDFRCARLSA